MRTSSRESFSPSWRSSPAVKRVTPSKYERSSASPRVRHPHDRAPAVRLARRARDQAVRLELVQRLRHARRRHVARARQLAGGQRSVRVVQHVQHAHAAAAVPAAHRAFAIHPQPAGLRH
jgi:hypothetical protein